MEVLIPTRLEKERDTQLTTGGGAGIMKGSVTAGHPPWPEMKARLG